MQRELTGSSLFRLAMVAVFFCAAFIPAAAQDRIAHSISASEPAQLHGNVHPLARAENDQGAADASMMLYRMVLTFQPSATQHADLEALLAEQQNPLSPYYRQWLTPEQYADRFGISANDMAKVAAWLQAQGFTVDESARSRTYIAFSGSSSQVESAFHTSIHRFLVGGEPHFANVSDPALPWSLANVALGIHGLNDFRLKPRGSVQPR
ncbi:MAG: protease pro-enzyme activation domain-containing protein, partial [Terriglobales bacterium]